jgi:hypothetical protein
MACAWSTVAALTGPSGFHRGRLAEDPSKQFIIDGEVALGVDGRSSFDNLYSGTHNDELQLYTFEALALRGDDLRGLPLLRPESPRSDPATKLIWRESVVGR